MAVHTPLIWTILLHPEKTTTNCPKISKQEQEQPSRSQHLHLLRGNLTTPRTPRIGPTRGNGRIRRLCVRLVSLRGSSKPSLPRPFPSENCLPILADVLRSVEEPPSTPKSCPKQWRVTICKGRPGNKLHCWRRRCIWFSLAWGVRLVRPYICVKRVIAN